MARNKAGKPGGPSSSPSGGETRRDQPEPAEETWAETAPGGAGADDPRRADEPVEAEHLRLEGPASVDTAATSPAAEERDASVTPRGGRDSWSASSEAAGRASGPAAGSPGPAPRPAAVAKPARGWPGALAAGVIGGAAAALALTWALPRDGGEMAALRAQVDRLEQAQAGVDGQSGAVAQLTTRLDALERGAGSDEIRGQIEALKAADAGLQKRLDALEPGATGAQLDDLTARLNQLDAAVAAAQSGGPSAAVTERLTELEDKLSELSTTVAQRQPATAGGGTDLADLTSRIGALEARLDQAEGARQEVEGLAGRLGAVTQQIVTGQEQTAGLNDKIAALGGEVGALTTRVDALSGTVDQLEQRMTGQDDRRSRAATLALSLAQLDAALDNGEPVEQVLGGLRALGADDPAVIKAVETLQAAAAANAPSLPALRDSFGRIANEVVHAEQAPDGAGLLDQAAGNLMRLVTVRPVGADVEGASAAARVARAEAALATGDLAAAVAEMEALQGPAAEAAAPWLAAAHARLAVLSAQAALQERATRLLSEAQ